MTSDIRAQQAREHHRESLRSAEEGRRHRSARNKLVRALRSEDPSRWTYPRLAGAVGCSPELIASIVKERKP